MTTWTRRTRAALGAWIAAGALLATAFVLATSAQAGSGADGRRVIAEASSNGFSAKVTARRAGRTRATVRIAAFEGRGDQRDRLGRPLVVGARRAWLWRVVTRPYGVRQLFLAFPGGSPHPVRIGIRLLISPSIGPSATFRFVVENNRLVAVDV
jgi:hypothetical protein